MSQCPAFDITDWAFQPTSMMAKCNPAWGKYLAVCLMYRGDVAHRDINAAIVIYIFQYIN